MFNLQDLIEAREKWGQESDIFAKIKTRKLCNLIFENPTIDEEECIKALDEGANPNVQSQYTPTAFIAVCENGLTKLAKSMIEHGAFLDQRGIYEHTPLCQALRSNHGEVASMLIEAGANVNCNGNSRLTPLMVAAANGNDDLVRLLMERGADP